MAAPVTWIPTWHTHPSALTSRIPDQAPVPLAGRGRADALRGHHTWQQQVPCDESFFTEDEAPDVVASLEDVATCRQRMTPRQNTNNFVDSLVFKKQSSKLELANGMSEACLPIYECDHLQHCKTASMG